MTDISYLHRFCASKWGWCWGLTLQAPNTSNTIQYASNIPDMAEIQSICTVFGHKLHGRGPAEKSAPACLVHGKTRPSLKHEAGMRMVQDESGWKRFDKRCDNAWQTVCGCLWMSADVCGCLWMSVVFVFGLWVLLASWEKRHEADLRSTAWPRSCCSSQQKLSQLQLFPPLPIWTFSDPRTPAENIDELQKEFLQRMVGCIEESEGGAN